MSEELHICLKALKVGYILGVFSFKWNPDNRCLEVAPCKWKKAHCIVNTLLYSIYSVNLLGRFVYNFYFRKGNAPATESSDFLAFAVSTLNALNIYVIITCDWRGCKGYMNRLIALDKNELVDKVQSHEHNRSLSNNNNPGLGRNHLQKSAILFTIILLVYSLRLVIRPEKPYHIPGMFEIARRRNSAMIGLIVLQLYLFCIQMFLCHWLLITIEYHGSVIYKHLRQLKLSGFQEFTSEQLKASASKFDILRILQSEHNGLWSSSYLVIFTVVIIVAVTNIYLAVATHTLKGIVGSATMCYLLRTLVNSVAQQYEASLEVLESWKHFRGNSLFRRRFKSTPPICTRNGGFGFIDRQLNLTFLGIIIDNAVTLVVGNRNA